MPADSTIIVAGGERENVSLFQSLSERSKHEDFIRRAVDLLVERVVFGRSSRSSKVVEWASPEEIKKTIDLKPRNGPVSHEELLAFMADVSKTYTSFNTTSEKSFQILKRHIKNNNFYYYYLNVKSR